MSKVESRLPFLRSNKPKAYEGNVYIISDNDRKLSDYEPVPVDNVAVRAQLISNDTSKAHVVKNGFTKSAISGLKGPAIISTSKAVAPSSGLKTPASGLKMPNSLATPKAGVVRKPVGLPSRLKTTTAATSSHADVGKAATGVKVANTPQHISSPTNYVKNSSPLESVQSHSKTSNSTNNNTKDAPVIPPKPVLSASTKSKLSTPAKVTQPSGVSKLSAPTQQSKQPTKSNSELNQSNLPPSSKNISKSESKLTKPVLTQSTGPIKPKGLSFSNKFQPSPTTKSNSDLTSLQNKVGSSTNVISRQQITSPINKSSINHQLKPVSSSTKTNTCQQMPSNLQEERKTAKLEKPKLPPETPPRLKTPSMIGGCNTSKSASQTQKLSPHSKLSAPLKLSTGLRKPSSITSPLSPENTNSLTPKAIEPSKVRQANIKVTSTVLEVGTKIGPVAIHQSHSFHQHCDFGQSSNHTASTQTAVLGEVIKLEAVQPVSSVDTSTTASLSVTVEQLDNCHASKVQTFCGPSMVTQNSVGDDDVFEAEPLTADAHILQCYSYLQQATPSSYHKHLVNSFTIKEQLSPTAESHARHIASSLPHPETSVATSLPQPWLSADIIENSSSEPHRELIIPDPPLEESDKAKSKLQAIDEGVEPAAESSIRNVTSVVKESTNDLTSKLSQTPDLTPLKPPSLLDNLFSKIGGRRILARPQESPPRARRTIISSSTKVDTGHGSSLNRRKLSPKSRRRDVKSPRHTKQAEQSSPKHKPLVQEDSPIRPKEAYYGGVHHHVPKSVDNNTEVCQANKISIRSINKAKRSCHSQQVDEGSSAVLSHDVQQYSACNSIKRCDTPISELNDMCRDDHMRFYCGNYSGTRTLPLPHTSTHALSNLSSQAMASIPVMSRSLTHKKKHKGSVDDGARLRTRYAATLRMGLPPCPDVPNTILEQGSSALSKVTVAVRLKPLGDAASSTINSYITADPGRGQLILRDPSNESNMAPSCRRQLAAVPKFFAFDTVFGGDALQMGVCKDTVMEILQSVLQGSDGCVTSFGHSKTGKSRSLIGDDSSCADFGIIPAAISWLYHLIEEQKTKTGARFSIRISALEIRGKDETLTDLLANCTSGTNGGCSEQVQLTTTDVYGAQVENLNEMRAPDVEHAGHYLDAALTTSYNLNERSESKGAHFLFTLHIYQHHVESKPSPGGALVAGGRSRLHFIDIGPCAKSSSDGSALTLAALGSAITALLNGQRHFPQKESKLATLLKDSVGHYNCRTCILVHISTQPSQYSETLQILQLAARIHRMKVRRRNKISSNSSDDTGSTNSNLRRRRGIKMGTSSSLSDPDVSSSEQSIDTVIYVPGSKHRHRHQSPAVYETNPMSKARIPYHEDVNGAARVGSPYNVCGAIKKRLSDDETSSEGRRRMPRTNARVWPRANSTENEIWLDTPPPPISRDQWHIPGNANPQPNNNVTQHNYYNPHAVQQQPHYQQHPPANYGQPNYSAPTQPAWLSLAQYNGHPEQIGQLTANNRNHNTDRQAWADTTDRKGSMAYTEVSKQELWVDGPTAFRKNIEGLTQNLQKDQLSPTKRHHRHHTPNHSGDRGDKSKHHHRTPSRKHRDSSKQCHQCGADIKKEAKSQPSTSKVEEKQAESKATDEPSLSVKPFVKDWVLRHSKNNTPTKTADNSENQNSRENTGTKDTTAMPNHERTKLIEEEAYIQDDLQLTVDLEEELLTLPDLPCSDNLMNDTSDMERQDEVQIDDSVSNVTADDRVGFESKEGSSFDENSLSEEVVEVCDAACQTEFTDSDSLSVQSNGVQSDSNMDNITVRVATTSSGITPHKRESTEAFLNATLQGTLLRKPDGASDPSLHKELMSPSTECKQDPLVQASSTLPRNAFLKAPKTTTKAPDRQTIKLQPYLSSPKQSSSQPSPSTPPSTDCIAQSNPKAASPERVPNKPESKLKKLSLFRQHSNNSQDNKDGKVPASNTGKKAKTSMLPGLRLSSKSKDSKSASNMPSTTAKKADPVKKEKRSFLQAPNKVKNVDRVETAKANSRLPFSTTAPPFDVTCSPYRQYVLPKPSYAHSEVCSDNSSCPAHPLATNKYSVSSGYESMTLNSAEDISQANTDSTKLQEDNSKTGVWIEPTVQPDSRSLNKVKEKVNRQRYEESQLSDNVTRQARIEELLYQQNLLKREMAEAKSRLMVPTSAWNFDSSLDLPNLHVASQIDRRNEDGYLEALEKETSILQKRVDACKSRIMLITSIF